MKNPAVEETIKDRKTFVNKEMDQLRRTECLCLNCINLDPNSPENCEIASKLYKLCVSNDVALAVTRCPLYAPRA